MARCRVCHRELTNPAHIAAGVGPICAQRAARFGVGTGTDTGAPAVASYPAERIERVERMLARLWQWTLDQEFNRALAAERGTSDDLAQFTAWVAFGWRWYERWQRIERRMKQGGRLAAMRAA